MFSSRRLGATWQFLFITLGTTWLWAPQLNHWLTSRTALISQYELPNQPYSLWLRAGDALAACLLIYVAYAQFKKSRNVGGWLLLIVAVGMLADPLFSTSCKIQGAVCHEYYSSAYLLHAIETVVTSSAVFLLAVYDLRLRSRMVSMAFVFFQIGYGILFLSQVASADRFNTLSQFIYQVAIILWLAWYVSEQSGKAYKSGYKESVKYFYAAWAFLNGLLAITLSLADLHLLGRFKGLYFAGDNAWLAQHGVIVGLVMLYLSRHLARGEQRARQLFLIICGIETLKYSVITPSPLLALYLLTFVALFIQKEAFDRGTIALNWRLKLKESLYLATSIALAAVLTLAFLYRDEHDSKITRASLDNFFDYTLRQEVVPKSHIQSALLAHTESAFLLGAAYLFLWVLFRPARAAKSKGGATNKEALTLLRRYSTSTEDYFKVWPADKQYFFAQTGDGFIAYKVAGSIAFALADPIAPTKQKETQLISEFIAYCRAHSWRACFLPVRDHSLNQYKDLGLSSLRIGASALIDMEKFVQQTQRGKWWRWQNNKSQKTGYEHRSHPAPLSPQLVAQLRAVSDSWLTKPGRKERAFALGYFEESYISNSTVHYLSHNGSVVAFTNLVPNFRKSSTITADLIRYLPDVGGAMSYLMAKTIEEIYNQGDYRYFDLGFVPFAATKDPALKIIRTLSTGRFSAKGLEQFKNKFEPEWQPNYLAYDGDLADLALIAINLERVMDLED